MLLKFLVQYLFNRICHNIFEYMKKLILLIAILPIIVSFAPKQQETLKWYSWNEGYPLAQKQGKILLIDAYTDWCGWCKRMDRDTYANADVVKKLNQHFIAIKFNPELSDLKYKVDSQTYSAAEFFGQLNRGESTGFPTTYFISPVKRSLLMQPGYLGPADFMTVMDKVISDNK